MSSHELSQQAYQELGDMERDSMTADDELLARLERHYEHAMEIDGHVVAASLKDAAARIRELKEQLEAEKQGHRLVVHQFPNEAELAPVLSVRPMIVLDLKL